MHCVVCFDKVQKVSIGYFHKGLKFGNGLAESLLKPNFESPERSIIPLKPLSNKRKIAIVPTLRYTQF